MGYVPAHVEDHAHGTCRCFEIDPDNVAGIVGGWMLPDDLTLAERKAVSRRMTEEGASAARIAEVLSVDPRTVFRYRKYERAA